MTLPCVFFLRLTAGKAHMECYFTEDGKYIKHSFTEGTAYMLYGLYHIVMVIIMLNMLIAMMSNTLSRIQVSACPESRSIHVQNPGQYMKIYSRAADYFKSFINQAVSTHKGYG